MVRIGRQVRAGPVLESVRAILVHGWAIGRPRRARHGLGGALIGGQRHDAAVDGRTALGRPAGYNPLACVCQTLTAKGQLLGQLVAAVSATTRQTSHQDHKPPSAYHEA